MIPVYNPAPRQLEQAIQSVLSQDSGVEAMQIEIVDDCSPDVNVQQLVKTVAGDRVRYSRNARNMGLAGCWNACVERARGEWVHILHQDDYVLPGFYSEIQSIAESHPDLGLIAVRSFYVTEEGIIDALTSRVKELEEGGRSVAELFYINPIECPGVTVRRSAYLKHGEFRSDLCYTLDWEMWARIIGLEGGLISSKVLACYRMAAGNATSRLARTGQTLADIDRLHRLFAQRYQDFNLKSANRKICDLALKQAWLFHVVNDREGEQASLRYWKRHAPLRAKARRYGGVFIRGLDNLSSKIRKGRSRIP
jgi:glycosyltransferase involved in cell wall biosynthesis